MRRTQKRQAEDFVELLGQAHEEIRKAIGKGNIPAALSLLADCQEGAVSLGDLVEKTAGENTAVIKELEEYCELVYGVYENLSGGNPAQEGAVSANHSYKRLRQALWRIRNGIRDIRVRREVVFLPYKASMWDSLESVWRAARADSGCDAYVVPIPYYDRKPDGSFGQMHYEGAQYPRDVPVTWYGEYDFAQRKPDIIFIHNPYDEYNHVTSVPPFFYSKNLKQFTERLVYIPYFVLDEINPDDRQALEGIKHFCALPGVVYADKVIVQSEKMRQAYVRIMTESYAAQGGRAYWEQKILGLGSPKIDKVLDTRKEDLDIPEEWMDVIRRPDGEWKKIVFYNTSLTALLETDRKMLDKMRDVFRVFRENRDETALLWRPHPLIRATIEAMRPQLWEEYREIVGRYREEGWGIYDDTPDVDRAIVLSDAYYGDRSSIVHLYQRTGKPVMIQDVEIRQDM